MYLLLRIHLIPCQCLWPGLVWYHEMKIYNQKDDDDKEHEIYIIHAVATLAVRKTKDTTSHYRHRLNFALSNKKTQSYWRNDQIAKHVVTAKEVLERERELI